MKKLLVAAFVVMVAVLPIQGAFATKTNPNEDHKVTICHRTGSADGGELKNGYNEITVDIASSGLVKGGHTGHDQVGNGPGPDIIPAYEAYAKVKGQWEEFSFDGKGLDWVFEDGTTGEEFLKNGCQFNDPEEPVDPVFTASIIAGDCTTLEATVVLSNTDDEGDDSVIYTIVVNGVQDLSDILVLDGDEVTVGVPVADGDVIEVYGRAVSDEGEATLLTSATVVLDCDHTTPPVDPDGPDGPGPSPDSLPETL